MSEVDEARLAAFADLQLIDVSELAYLAKTGEDWIRKGCQARTLPFTRVGDTYRFNRQQVAEIWAIKTSERAAVPTRDEVTEKRQGRDRKAAA